MKDKKVCEALKKQIVPLPKSVLLYIPLLNELNVFALLYFFKQKGVRVFVPKLTNQEGEFEITPFRLPLKKGKFDLLEPKRSKFYLKKINLAIVPILGIDCKARRVGFGKGYYDRFFQKLLHKPYIIFISRYFVYSKQIISEDFDVRGDRIVSWKCQIRRKKSGMDVDKPYYFSYYRYWYDCVDHSKKSNIIQKSSKLRG